MTTTIDLNEEKLEAFIDRAFTDLAACYGGVMVSLGDRLGLYRALAGAGPLTSAELAERAGCAERYVREWLGSQVAAAYLEYDPATETYELPAEHAAVLADPDSPTLLTPAFNVPASMWIDEEQAAQAFRTGEGVPWGAHHDRLFCGVAAFYRNAYRGALVPQWLPALDGVVEQLERGAKVADIGCGHGHSAVLMAEAFPNSTFVGIDPHEESIAAAIENAAAAGVSDRVSFSVGTATDYAGAGLRPDLLLRRPARHGRPGRRGAARALGARRGRHRHAGRAVRRGCGRGQRGADQPRLLLGVDHALLRARALGGRATTCSAPRPARPGSPTSSPRPASPTGASPSRLRSTWSWRRGRERGPEGREVGCPEDHAIARGHVDEIEVHSGPGDLASQVRQHAGAVLDLDHHDLALAGDREMGDRQGMPHGLGVRDEDVELGPLARPDAGCRRDVHAGIADRGRDLRQRPRGVLDVDDQVDCHGPRQPTSPAQVRAGGRSWFPLWDIPP